MVMILMGNDMDSAFEWFENVLISRISFNMARLGWTRATFNTTSDPIYVYMCIYMRQIILI